MDLSDDLDEQIVKELRELFLDRMVLVFRDQLITREQHKGLRVILVIYTFILQNEMV